MSYRIFLSHNTTQDEMVVVWRLQTLASASGVHLDVPNPDQRAKPNILTKMIFDADAVISLITKQLSQQVKTELNLAVNYNKLIIPIVEQGIPTGSIQSFLNRSNTQIFILDRKQPWKMEQELSQFLQKQKLNKDTKNAILALTGTFIGLYLLQELTKS